MPCADRLSKEDQSLPATQLRQVTRIVSLNLPHSVTGHVIERALM